MRLAWLLVAFCAALTACDSSGGDPLTPAPTTPDGPTLVPLAVGNEWVFAATRTRFDPDTGEPGEAEALPGRDTLRVVDAVYEDGEVWFELDVAPGSSAGTVLRIAYGGWVTNRADGYYRRVGADSTAFRTVRFPAAVGDVYSVVPPFALTDSTGFHFEREVAVKRTDYPVALGGAAYDGVLYTGTLQRLRVGGRDYGFPASTPPLREVYAPGLGFAVLETGYASLRNDTEASLDGLYRFTLTDAEVAVVVE